MDEPMRSLLVSQGDLDNWFNYHRPKELQPERYAKLREAAKKYAEEILAITQPSQEQAAALMLVRQASMMANAAIACNE